MDDLASLLGVSRRTILRAVALLKSEGLLTTTRNTWRKGYDAPHTYYVTYSGRYPQPEADVTAAAATEQSCSSTEQPVVEELRSSPTRNMSKSSCLSVTNTILGRLRHPKRAQSARGGAITLPKWQEDDDISGGFGLLPEDLAPKAKSPSARSTKNRGHRPLATWTPADVAAEFILRLEQEMPRLRGVVPITRSGIILAAMRKRKGTTPEIEMQMLDIWFGDTRNLQGLGSKPDAAFQRWLGAWARLMPRALDNLGLPPLNAPLDASHASQRGSKAAPVPGSSPAPAEAPRDVLMSSDGIEFPNSIAGRSLLAKYEARLVKA